MSSFLAKLQAVLLLALLCLLSEGQVLTGTGTANRPRGSSTSWRGGRWRKRPGSFTPGAPGAGLALGPGAAAGSATRGQNRASQKAWIIPVALLGSILFVLLAFVGIFRAVKKTWPTPKQLCGGKRTAKRAGAKQIQDDEEGMVTEKERAERVEMERI